MYIVKLKDKEFRIMFLCDALELAIGFFNQGLDCAVINRFTGEVMMGLNKDMLPYISHAVIEKL